MHKYVNLYVCVCGEDVEEIDITGLITAYSMDEATRIVTCHFMHRGCYLSRINTVRYN